MVASPLKSRLIPIALLALGILFFLLPSSYWAEESSLPSLAWKTAGVATLMTLLWITEYLPIPVTSLLPLILFPILGILDFSKTSGHYSHPLVFLYGGGFLLAIAVEKWNLHKRLSLFVFRLFGTMPNQVFLGFLVATSFLSMWASNTATTLLILPIGLSVITVLTPFFLEHQSQVNFTKRLYLGIAYAASIGGMATLVGSPPNALLAGYIHQSLGIEIPFWKWMVYALPICLVLISTVYFIFAYSLFPVVLENAPPHDYLETEWKALGPVQKEEKIVGIVFSFTALLWVCLPLLKVYLPFLTDSGIAILGAFVLFWIPGRTSRILVWEDAKKLPWDIILLFGGGLSLATAIETTGLSTSFGKLFASSQEYSILFWMAVVAIAVLAFTNLASNVATVAAFLPICLGMAQSTGVDPLYYCLPVALIAGSAFLLPVATPPNAIVYSAGVIQVKDMIRAGAVLSLVALVVILLWTFLVLHHTPLFSPQSSL